MLYHSLVTIKLLRPITIASAGQGRCPNYPLLAFQLAAKNQTEVSRKVFVFKTTLSSIAHSLFETSRLIAFLLNCLRWQETSELVLLPLWQCSRPTQQVLRILYLLLFFRGHAGLILKRIF